MHVKALSLVRSFGGRLWGALVLVGALGTGCGGDGDRVVGEFTSSVVQRNSCKVTGDAPESCVRDDRESRLRVSLVEDEFDRVWISGIEVGGLPNGRVLGTRDINGDFLFYDFLQQENAESGCVLTQEITLSLGIDPLAAPDAIGTDPCVALIGRETRTTTTSLECDDVNDPPLQVQRIVRRRWEPPAACTPELTD